MDFLSVTLFYQYSKLGWWGLYCILVFWPYLSIFQIKERTDNEEDIILVDTEDLKKEKKEEKVEKDSEVKKEGKVSKEN